MLSNKKFQFVFLRNNHSFDARSKAPKDVETILDRLGYRPIYVSMYLDGSSKFRSLRLCRDLLLQVLRLPLGSELIVQYPLTSYFYLMAPLLRLKRIKTIALVHDLESYRYSGTISNRERKNLLSFNRIIVHTEAMAKVLEEAGIPKLKLKILGFFDYLVENGMKGEPEKDYMGKICVSFAGNLTKSLFLKQLVKLNLGDLHLRLYGAEPLPGMEGISNCSYAGGFSPDDLRSLNGAWGLVWDGEGIDTCSGAMGNYLRINAPHKMSLYLAKGIPLIVWRESGVAPIVERYKLGVCVNSLDEIPRVLSTLSDNDLTEIHRSVEKWGECVRSGAMLEQVLDLH